MKQQLVFVLLCLAGVFPVAAQVDSAYYISTDTISTTTASVSAPADSSALFIAGITFYGNKKTRQNIIEREIPFRQGDFIQEKELEAKLIKAKHQIINTGLFVEALVKVEAKQEGLVFISVTVKEKWYIYPVPYFKLIDRNFNEWLVTHEGSLERVNYGLKFQYNNFTGRNDKLNVWMISGYSKQLAFKYERPYIDAELKHGFNVYFNYSRQREINFRTEPFTSTQDFITFPDQFIKQIIRVNADYVYRPAIKTKHIVRLSYINEKLNDTVLKANPNFFQSPNNRIEFPEVTYILQHFNTDYNVYPTKGYLFETAITQRGFSKNFNMTQLSFTGSHTIPINKKAQLQFTAGGILRFPFNQPYYNKPMFGYGGIFLQGLEYYVMDGVAGAVGKATARRQILSFSLKSPNMVKRDINVPVRVLAKTFVNTGYAYNRGSGITHLNNRWLTTCGIGADVIVAYDIVFKFDYSFNQFGESGLFFHAKKDF